MEAPAKMYRSHLNDPHYKGEKTGSHLGNGPLESRSCTDILCYILFILCWVGSVFIALYAFSKGQPAQAFTPVDSAGIFITSLRTTHISCSFFANIAQESIVESITTPAITISITQT